MSRVLGVLGALLLMVVLVVVGALAYLLPVSSTGSRALTVAAQTVPGVDQRGITVIGEGSASARPDQATITVGVQATRPTAAEALTETNRATEAVLAKLDQLGISRANVQTSGVNLFPVQEGPRSPSGEPAISGYRAMNQLTVLVSDLDKVGQVLDSVVAAGANQVMGVRFGLRDDSALRAQALQTAIGSVCARADAMASGLNLKTDQVLSVREEATFGPVSAIEQGGKGAAGSVPIEAGQLTVQVRVQVTFALVPAS